MQKIDRFKTSFYLPAMVFLTMVSFSVHPVNGQNASGLWGGLRAGAYQVGFKVLYEKDSSRSFPKQNGEKFIAAPREIKISLWYPAQNSRTASPKMKFSEYVSALEDAGAKAVEMESRNRFKKLPVAQELPATAIINLLRTETSAFRDAPFIKNKKFPVIVLGQGLYYESPTTHTVLCEFLASQGFIIATTELMGAHSPFVKLDVVDLEAAVRDLEFIGGRVRSLENADKERLAVIGFDMGGLAGLIFAMRNREIDAYASLDSGILAAHNLNLIKAMPDYDPLRLRAPLFHATHPIEELARFNVSEDTSFMDAARFSDRLILRFPDVRHADFTSRSLIESVAAEMRDARTTHRRSNYETVAQSLLVFLKAHLQHDSKRLDALYAQISVDPDSKVKFTKERNPPEASAPFSEAEFLNYLYLGGAEKAVALFRRLRAQFPNEQFIREETLNQVGYDRLYRGAVSEAILIFKLNVEAFPKSENAYNSLGEAYMSAGNNTEAIRNYRKSLEINPRNEKANLQLKRLEVKK